MAHVAKFGMAAAMAAFRHDSRYEDEPVKARTNERIRPDATGSNLVMGYRKDGTLFRGRITEGIADAMRRNVSRGLSRAAERHKDVTGRALRTDAKVMASWVVTRPPEISDADVDDFFGRVCEFIAGRYGRKNFLYATIHKDETTDHVHVNFMPRKSDGRFCAKEVVNRRDLQTFHQDLSDYLEECGMPCSILLEEDDPRKQFPNLPLKDYQNFMRMGSEMVSAVREREKRVVDAENELKARAARLSRRESELDEREARVTAGEKDILQFWRLQKRSYNRLKNWEMAGKMDIAAVETMDGIADKIENHDLNRGAHGVDADEGIDLTDAPAKAVGEWELGY